MDLSKAPNNTVSPHLSGLDSNTTKSSKVSILANPIINSHQLNGLTGLSNALKLLESFRNLFSGSREEIIEERKSFRRKLSDDYKSIRNAKSFDSLTIDNEFHFEISQIAKLPDHLSPDQKLTEYQASLNFYSEISQENYPEKLNEKFGSDFHHWDFSLYLSLQYPEFFNWIEESTIVALSELSLLQPTFYYQDLGTRYSSCQSILNQLKSEGKCHQAELDIFLDWVLQVSFKTLNPGDETDVVCLKNYFALLLKWKPKPMSFKIGALEFELQPDSQFNFSENLIPENQGYSLGFKIDCLYKKDKMADHLLLHFGNLPGENGTLLSDFRTYGLSCYLKNREDLEVPIPVWSKDLGFEWMNSLTPWIQVQLDLPGELNQDYWKGMVSSQDLFLGAQNGKLELPKLFLCGIRKNTGECPENLGEIFKSLIFYSLIHFIFLPSRKDLYLEFLAESGVKLD